MKSKAILAVVVMLLMCSWLVAPVLAAEGTITGKVTEDLQIITADGDLYQVAESDQAEDLMDHVGKTVKATGTLSEEDGEKTITITGFTVMDE